MVYTNCGVAVSGVKAPPTRFTPRCFGVAVAPVPQEAAATHRVNYLRYKLEDYV